MIISHRKPVMRTLALGVAMALTAATTSALATTTRTYTDRQTIASHHGWSDPNMASMALSAGRSLLDDLRSVKADLDNGMIGAARSQLITSAEFAGAIGRMMPYVVVADRVTDAKHELVDDSADVFYTDLLPIYTGLEEMEVYAPDVAKAARKGVKEAEKHARSGNTKAAAEQLQKVADDLAESTVYLPVLFIADQIHVAQAAMNKTPPDLSTAKQAVNNALGSLVVRSDLTMRSPAS